MRFIKFLIDFPVLFAKGVYYHLWEITQYLQVVFLYYRSWRFACADLLVHCLYLFSNAHNLCVKALGHHESSEVQAIYVETAITALHRIFIDAGVKSEDVFYELGSGRGRLVFWAATFFKMPAVGIELTPVFVRRAKLIKKICAINNAEFIEQNIFDADLSTATVIYLYGTAFEPEVWPKIIKLLGTSQPGTKIISVTYSVEEFGGSINDFRLENEWVFHYMWGKTPVYLHTRL